MGFGDDVANNAKEAVGKAKEGLGDAMNNESLERQGEKDQVVANANKAKEHVKDAAEDVKDTFR